MLQIDEKYIEQYIEQTKEKQKNTNQANCADFSFSKMLEYRHIPIDNIEIYIEFKDKFCNICKNFVFDFVGNIKLLSVKNVIYSNTSFANLKSKQIIFNNCDIQWLKLGDSIECDNIIFTNCKINSISFINPSSHYRFKDACFKFYHCSIDNILIANGLWHKVEFCKEISFVGCRFLNDKNGISLSNYIFGKKANFSNCKFYTDVYFNNSTFHDYADFHECKFEKVACFYGATFEKVPNFSQAIFKENLNMINTNLNFDFDELNEKIKQEYEYFNKNKEEKDKKSLDKFANDFRDSFRLIKNALIKDNNLLDASNFHKYELYCKEIELEQIWHRQGKSAETEVDTRRNTQKFRDYIDCLLLGFYRKLCDHHTDFLKVFNNLVLLIALYILFSLSFAHTRDIETILVSLKYPYITVGSFICVFLGIVLLKYSKKLLIFTKEKQCEKNHILMPIKDFYYLIKSLFLALFFTCIFYVLYELVRKNQLSCNDFGYSVFTNVSFISLYLCLVYTKSLYFGRYILVFICYILLLVNFIENPIIIHPLIRKIGDISIGSSPSTIALNISYTILIGLVLFSLQKTARKNSIVPH